MIYDRSRLLRADLLHRPAHSLHRPHGVMMMFDRGTHRIRRRLAYDGVDRSHRLHRSHRLGRAHAVLERTHRRGIGRSARSLPTSRHRRRAAASAEHSAAAAAATVTLRYPTVRMIHCRCEPPSVHPYSRISQLHGPVRCHDLLLSVAVLSRTVTRWRVTTRHDASRRAPRAARSRSAKNGRTSTAETNRDPRRKRNERNRVEEHARVRLSDGRDANEERGRER